MAKFKIGLVGLGVMGRNHLRTLQAMEQVEIVGVSDKRKIEEEKIDYYENFSDLVLQKPDGIIIATPTSSHKEIALDCLNNNIPVLIEKPVAATVEEGRALLEVEIKKNKSVSAHVGYIERFNPAVECLKKEISKAKIVKIMMTRVGPYPARIADVGILCDLSVHDIDLLRYLCNDELESYAIYDAKTKHTYEDSAFINGKTSKGTIVSISTSWLSPKRKRQLEIYTKDFFYKVDLFKKRVWKQSLDNQSQEVISEELVVESKQALESQMKEWLKFLETKKPCRLATISDSLKTLEIIKKSFSHEGLKNYYLARKKKDLSSEAENYFS